MATHAGRAATFKLAIPANGRTDGIPVPGSAGRQRPSPGLTLEAHARPYKIAEPDGQTKQLLAVTIMVVNRRKETIRCFADVTFTFQVRLEVHCQKGLHPRTGLTGRGSSDLDAALADLHYPDVVDYARGSNALAGWHADEDGRVRYVSSSTSRRRRFREPLVLGTRESTDNVGASWRGLSRMSADLRDELRG